MKLIPYWGKRAQEQIQFRYTRLIHIRWFLSLPMLFSSLGIFLAFTFSRTPITTQPYVAALEYYNYWNITFGLAFLFLVWTLVKKCRIEMGHFVASGVHVGYGLQSLFGAILVGAPAVGTVFAFSLATVGIVIGVIFAKGRD